MICSELTWTVLSHAFFSAISLTVQLNSTRPTGVSLNIFLSDDWALKLLCQDSMKEVLFHAAGNLYRTNSNASSFSIPRLGSQDEHCKRRKRLLL